MKQAHEARESKIEIKTTDLELNFPEPDCFLIEDAGPPIPWEQWMAETAAQTNYWLKHYGPDLSPPPFEERFSLD